MFKKKGQDELLIITIIGEGETGNGEIKEAMGDLRAVAMIGEDVVFVGDRK